MASGHWEPQGDLEDGAQISMRSSCWVVGRQRYTRRGSWRNAVPPAADLRPELLPAAKAHSCHQMFAEEGLDSVPAQCLLRVSTASQVTSDA